MTPSSMRRRCDTPPNACARSHDAHRVADPTQAIELVPESPEAHIDRGFAKLKSKDYAGAVEDYKFAHAHGRDDANTVHALATALSQLGSTQANSGDTAGAVASFAEAVDLQPSEGRCFNLGMVRMQAGDSDGAIAACRQALEFNPANFQAWYMIAAVALQNESWETAVEAFDKAREIKVRRLCRA